MRIVAAIAIGILGIGYWAATAGAPAVQAQVQARGGDVWRLPPERRPVLAVGSRGEAVADLQRALAWLGVDPGPLDGRFGPRTARAVRTAQRLLGVRPDGRVGAETWRRLGEALADARLVHSVRPGDTLYGIARRYGTSPRELARLNRLPDPDRLRPGQRLLVRLTLVQVLARRRELAGRPGGPSGVAQTPARGATPPASHRLAGGAPGEPAARAAPAPAPARRRGPVPVALTFNDGPDPAVTAELLAVLRRHRVRATFFVVGAQAERFPDLVRQMAADGHEVENHGYLHRPLVGLPLQEIRADVARAARVIERLTGRRPVFFRPPHAAMDAAVVAAVQAEGERVLLWTNVGAEHDPRLPIPEQVDRLVRAAHPGAVLMLHADRPGAGRLVDALLTEFQRRGMVPVPLGQLLRVARSR